MEPTPCQEDFETTGRDWTEVPSSSAEARSMTYQCRNHCPMVEACYRLALEQEGAQHGVWGGLVWRNGKAVDPEEKAYVRRSIHEGVAWDGSKRGERGVGMWKAFGVVRFAPGAKGRRAVHLGYYETEDEAAEAYRRWVDDGKPMSESA